MKYIFRIALLLLVAISTLPSVKADPDVIKHELQFVNLQVDIADIQTITVNDLAIHQISAIPIHAIEAWLFTDQSSLHLVTLEISETVPIIMRSTDLNLNYNQIIRKHSYTEIANSQSKASRPSITIRVRAKSLYLQIKESKSLAVPWQTHINDYLQQKSLI